MHHRTKEPKASEYHLCWEPTLEEASVLLGALELVASDQKTVSLNFVSETRESVLDFLKELRRQVTEVEDELEDAVKRYEQRQESAATRLVNEEQLQEAVAFLGRVWAGEEEATLSQVAAARCFMRAGEDY